MPSKAPQHQTTIQVQKVWPPKGRGPYGIIDMSNTRYGVWQDQWQKLQIQEGGKYSIIYEDNAYVGQDGQPRTSHNIISAQPVGNAATNSGAKPAATPPPSYSNNPGAAIMGMVNQFIARGDVPCDSKLMADLINKCKTGYEMSELWPKPKPQVAEDLNDEIPY
jgi:hypothetical protein